MKQRLSIALLADEGLTNAEIAKHVPLNVQTIGRWRNRFAESGLAGIEKDRPRGANHGGADSAKQTILRKKVIKWTTGKRAITPSIALTV